MNEQQRQQILQEIDQIILEIEKTDVNSAERAKLLLLMINTINLLPDE